MLLALGKHSPHTWEIAAPGLQLQRASALAVSARSSRQPVALQEGCCMEVLAPGLMLPQQRQNARRIVRGARCCRLLKRGTPPLAQTRRSACHAALLHLQTLECLV